MRCNISLPLFAGFIALTNGAWAQDAPATISGPNKAPNISANDCEALYPSQLKATGVDGTTTLSLRVLRDGGFADVSVLKSSGNADLDSAALQCAATTKRPPLTSNGRSVEVQWQGEVIWRHDWPHVWVLVPASSACSVRRYYPTRAVRLGEQGDVIATYQIGTDGSAGNFVITQSSGYADLDQATIDCFGSLHFPPATENGQPIPIDRLNKISWRLWGG